MGSCCDEGNDDVLKHLMNFHLSRSSSSSEESLSRSSPSFGCSTIISPVDSVFPALACGDILRTIFEKLPISALFRVRCVCRVWNSVASERDIVIRAFMSPWKLKGVVGNPLSGSFWRDNGLAKFAISHRIVRGDTVTSLAVRYSVQVMDIKRLNNMMSDHGVYSRERLLIPISNPDILINRTCYIEMDDCAKREVAVIYPEDVPDDSCRYLSDRMPLEEGNRISMVKGKRRVIDSLRRSMQVDGETARYYWSISNGDPRAALSEFSADLQWERQAGLS
ncbi:F-box protein At1g55000-like [Prosopis cineraria]|uniref:F-box protein At1g55000-like n=1 Tax=Prosopis cineraria TaxID=364024 RepID=UPI00241091E1|nr:F-box protein At1g55000-like [Prosopis cineraria]